MSFHHSTDPTKFFDADSPFGVLYKEGLDVGEKGNEVTSSPFR
jgi:hypothetical protein